MSLTPPTRERTVAHIRANYPPDRQERLLLALAIIESEGGPK